MYFKSVMIEVDDFHSLFVHSRHDMELKRGIQKVKTKNKLSNQFDKLFFNFLIILKYDFPYEYNAHEEKKIKYKFAEKMESFSYRGKEPLLQKMCYEEHIDLPILFCMGRFFNVNLIYYCDHVFHKGICDETKPIYIVKESKDIHSIGLDHMNMLIDDSYEIVNIHKPLYSMSHYKLEELKHMISLMHFSIDTSLEKTYKKKDYYEMIETFFKRILI